MLSGDLFERDFIIAFEAIPKFRVFAISPYDVASRGAVAKKHLENTSRVPLQEELNKTAFRCFSLLDIQGTCTFLNLNCSA